MKTKEQILEDNLSEHLLTLINTYPVAYKADEMLKDWILNAMEEYHAQFEQPQQTDSAKREAWECPRCHMIHSWLHMVCDCPPDLITGTTYHETNLQQTETAKDRYGYPLTIANNEIRQIMLSAEWDIIEAEFIKWDNESRNNASQRQILDWFKSRSNPRQTKLPDEMSPRIAKLILQMRDIYISADIIDDLKVEETYHLLYQIASPGYSKLSNDVWSEIEKIANNK